MASVRENILGSTQARDKYLQGVVALNQEMRGITAQDVFQFLQDNSIPLPMQRINQQLSTYDLFVLWHVVAMSIPIPPGNAAHSAPIFLPWHRLYLIRLEEEIQRVLGDNTVGLPYWDWAADGELPVNDQWQTQLWNQDHLGEARGQLQSGTLNAMRVRLYQNPMNGTLLSIQPRQITREAGLDANFPVLPMKSGVQQALDETDYDDFPWSQSSIGHRNRLEGWIDGPQLHNLVHVWIGGDMAPGTSPNDPVFFLNHCNVDRIWEAWMGENGRVYAPLANQGPAGHRINDLMVAILGAALPPSDVLDPAQWYSYDSLTVA
jgi:tyrosinase